MKRIVTASACAIVLGALALGCYEETTAQPVRSARGAEITTTTTTTHATAPQQPAPPPPSNNVVVAPQMQVQAQPSPPPAAGTAGVTNVQPTTPTYDTSMSGYKTRAQQLLSAARQRIDQLRGFEQKASEPTRSNIDAAIADIAQKRDRLFGDLSKMDSVSADLWSDFRTKLDGEMSDLTRSIQASDAALNAVPRPARAPEPPPPGDHESYPSDR